jgi:hypothetical protein
MIEMKLHNQTLSLHIEHQSHVDHLLTKAHVGSNEKRQENRLVIFD